MTIKEIIEKYPKIFEHYEGNPNGVNWFGVPNGWLTIINNLCGTIQSYCDHQRPVPNPDYDHTKEYDKEDPTTHRYNQVKPAQVTCVQMKEKFGGLRFYTNGHDDIVDGMIRMATHTCDNTCESCGTTENLGITAGWISIRCKKCAEEANRAWMTKEDWKIF
jgi:hypothetical protein